jgi:hypothetical protein
MSGLGSKPYKSPSAWDFERRRFQSLLERWLAHSLDKFFDLTIHGPTYRKYRILALAVAFIAAAFVVHIFLDVYPILAPTRQISFSSLSTFFIVTILRLVLVLLIPAYLAIQMAGNYLADIFELKDTTVAWRFIEELSLGGAGEVLHIRDGKVAEDDQDSPILLIGGPGRVQVEFDSAALFEKPDGRPHVIGPAGGKSEANEADNTIVEGFERLREPIINLRDQYVGNPSAEPMTIVSRSLDGLPVSATDVRVVFSARRDEGQDVEQAPKGAPFLIHPQSAEALIYQQSVSVLTEGPHPSSLPPPWTNIMQGLVRGAIGEFMSQNKLSEYLASIGSQEIEISEFREDTILQQTLQYSGEAPERTAENIVKPKFHPRTELSERFRKYAGGFSKKARERGMELHWIGVGTWRIPDEIAGEVINDQHLEAWRISRDNAARANPQSLETAAEDAYLNERLRLIRSVPFTAHQKNQIKYAEKEKMVKALLQDYWEQLGDALEVYYKQGTRSSELEEIERAVIRIERLLNIAGGHTIGSSLSKVRRMPPAAMDEDAPPAPASAAEAAAYRTLLSKLDGNYKVAEHMIANESRRYPTLLREELIQRIVRRLERYGR